MPRLGIVVAFATLFAGYVVLSAVLPPADDELYYWCWAQKPQLSYFDHPPMVAWLIRISTELFGDSVVALRLPACLSTLVVFAVICWLTRPINLIAMVFLTPLFTLGAILVTPDTPLMLFWSLYLAWLTCVHRRLTPEVSDESNPDPGSPIPVWMWLVGGLILGCAGLGKYTSVLAVPAGFVSFLMAGVPVRRWLPGYVGHGAIAAACTIPVLAFNLDRDFEPLLFQLRHASGNGSGGLKHLGEFLGVQLLLFGALPLVLLPWIWWNFRTISADPRLRAAVALYAVPFTFFLYKATRGHLEGNWALACYVGFWPVAGYWYRTVAAGRPLLQWFTASTFLLPTGAVVVLAIHLVHPLPWMPPHRDRLTRQSLRIDVARQAAEDVRADGRPWPVFTPTYQWTANLRFFGADARQMAGVTRPSHFTHPGDFLADFDEAYVFNEGLVPPEHAPGFGKPEVVGVYPITVRGHPYTVLLLMRYTREKPNADSVASRTVR